MRSLDHPNITKLIEIQETDNEIYLILELLEGGEIFADDNTTNFTISQRKHLIRSILSGLVLMTSKGIMHRDIKPRNILLKEKAKIPLEKKTIKILDFGLSTIHSKKHWIHKRCGTPGYVAPEVLRKAPKTNKKPYGPKCDVFSLGVMFYFLVVGEHPFDADSVQSMIERNKICLADFSKLEKVGLNQPEEVDLIKKMMEEDLEVRLSAEECLEHPYFFVDKNFGSESSSFGNESMDCLEINQEEGFEIGARMKQFRQKYQTNFFKIFDSAKNIETSRTKEVKGKARAGGSWKSSDTCTSGSMNLGDESLGMAGYGGLVFSPKESHGNSVESFSPKSNFGKEDKGNEFYRYILMKKGSRELGNIGFDLAKEMQKAIGEVKRTGSGEKFGN